MIVIVGDCCLEIWDLVQSDSFLSFFSEHEDQSQHSDDTNHDDNISCCLDLAELNIMDVKESRAPQSISHLERG